MLTELRLGCLGVVADASIPLTSGLTALTGETGAGKTMIVAGLGLLLGARGDAGVVRHGCRRAIVEGRWDVPPTLAAVVQEMGGDIDDGQELITTRQVSAQGRSRASVGGAQVPVSTLPGLLGGLATIHGQSEQLRLSSAERQREILDAFAQPEALPQYWADWHERQALATELADLVEQSQARAREIDMLRFGLDEINAVEPRDGEDDALAAETTRLQDADELKRLAGVAQTVLSGDEDDFDVPGAVGLVGEARKVLVGLAERDPSAGALADKIREVEYLLRDVAGEAAGYAVDLVADPVRLEAVSERRAALAALTRKYGPALTDVNRWAAEADERLGSLEHSDERISELRSRLADLDRHLATGAADIARDRRRAAREFEERVRSELAALAMPHATLSFRLTSVELGANGSDRIELVFSANPGAPPAPLAKVASGGELSRIRLALEVVLAGHAEGHTYVFDEVDAGVGGAVGLEIGRRLQRLAETSQVLVVTHLAQVAAFADAHFVVSKSSDGQVTTADVHRVDGRARVAVLARMMSGSGSSSAGLEHATELLEQAARRTG